MNMDIYGETAAILQASFQVDPSRIQPEATLESLGLDSLALMEFVFAVEDRFSVRVPESKLDPRQAGITLAHLALLLEEQLGAPREPSASAA